MESATKNLENDHISILKLLTVMEKMVFHKSSNPEHFERVVNLIRNYADGFHHAKEENILFPLMIKKGFSKEVGPVAVMLHDHDQGRSYVKAISKGIIELKEGNDAVLTDIYENMKNYVILLRNHIDKENNVLFRMADKAFSEKDQKDLLLEFAEVENGTQYLDKLTAYLEDIKSLEMAYE